MRADRDTFVLLLTLIPAAFVVYCFVVWQSTGNWPAQLPAVNMPSIPIPGWLTRYTTVPPGAHSMLDRYRQTWPSVLVGLGAGLLLGILAMGTFTDGVRVGAKWLSRLGRKDDDDDEVADTTTSA